MYIYIQPFNQNCGLASHTTHVVCINFIREKLIIAVMIYDEQGKLGLTDKLRGADSKADSKKRDLEAAEHLGVPTQMILAHTCARWYTKQGPGRRNNGETQMFAQLSIRNSDADLITRGQRSKKSLVPERRNLSSHKKKIYVRSGTYSLMSTLNGRFLRTFFMADLYTL